MSAALEEGVPCHNADGFGLRAAKGQERQLLKLHASPDADVVAA